MPNLLIERLLKLSGFRWDISNWMLMCEFFAAQPEEDKVAFSNTARSMPLAEFEKTVYWGIVSGYVVVRDQRCKGCNIPYGLQVHHATYEHRGQEHLHLDDLRALCRMCRADKHPHLGLKLAKEIMERSEKGITIEEALRERAVDDRRRRLNGAANREIRSPLE